MSLIYSIIVTIVGGLIIVYLIHINKLKDLGWSYFFGFLVGTIASMF